METKYAFTSKDKILIFEDEYLLATNKMPGWETVTKSGKYCFTTLVRDLFNSSNLTPIHRLDRDTSGLLLFAKTEDVRTKFIPIFQEKKIKKKYLAFTMGVPKSSTGSIKRNLTPWTEGGKEPVRVTKSPTEGLSATTDYRVIETIQHAITQDAITRPKNFSFVEFSPHEGRSHQIRVHAAHLNIPILGDDQYGHRETNLMVKKETGLYRQALHAFSLDYNHPITNTKVLLRAELPEDFIKLLIFFKEMKMKQFYYVQNPETKVSRELLDYLCLNNAGR